MRQKTNENVKSNVSVQDMAIDKPRPRTRAYIKQENEDIQESLRSALYSSVKIESSSLEISTYESSVKNRPEKHFLSHERHPNKTKETPINDLKKEFCNVCDTQFTSTTSYCSHINNIQKPKPKRIYKPDPPKTPNAKDLNSYYCGSCSITFNGRAGYSNRLNNINRTPHLISPKLQNLKNMKPKIDILDLCCDVCKKIYPCKRLYIRHLVKFHEITLPNVYLEPTNFDSISRYCKVCDISFRQDSTFAAHLRNMHPTAIHSGPDLIPNMNEKKFTVFRANKRLSVDNLIYIICLLFILTKCLKFIKEQIARTLV